MTTALRVSLTELAPDVYGVMGRGGMPNAAFVVADGGVLAIDSLYSPSYAREMLTLIREVTSDPVRILVNTHHHADHVFGNDTLGATRIVAHELAFADLARLGDAYVDAVRQRRPDLAEELSGTRLRLPTETVGETAVVEYAGTALELTHHGRTAHTRGDLVVRVRDRDVLIAGDLVFNGVMPPMLDGDIDGLRETLVELGGRRSGVVLPGHGAVGGPDVVAGQVAMIDHIVETATSVRASGGDQPAAIGAALAGLSDRISAPERVPAWIRQIYSTRPDGSRLT
jgi:cyclase